MECGIGIVHSDNYFIWKRIYCHLSQRMASRKVGFAFRTMISKFIIKELSPAKDPISSLHHP